MKKTLLAFMLSLCLHSYAATGESFLWASERNELSGMAYIAAVVDYNGLLAAGGGTPEFCAPDGVSSKQQLEVVRQYIKKDPKSWNYSAWDLVREALAEAWPCGKK